MTLPSHLPFASSGMRHCTGTDSKSGSKPSRSAYAIRACSIMGRLRVASLRLPRWDNDQPVFQPRGKNGNLGLGFDPSGFVHRVKVEDIVEHHAKVRVWV